MRKDASAAAPAREVDTAAAPRALPAESAAAATARAREKKGKLDALGAFLSSPTAHVVEWKTGETFEKARTMDPDEFARHFRRGAESLNGVGWPERLAEKKRT
jgi:hypothetical protein